MPIFAGYCYRYFAIADASIADLDLLIERKGVLVGDDKTSARTPSSTPIRRGARTRTRASSST